MTHMERNLDFDIVIDRKGTDCLKYDFAVKRGMPEDALPLWVADMDFKTSSYVEDAIIERTKHGIFGYTEVQESYFEAVSGWYLRHHNWQIQPEWLVKTPGVVFALAMAVKAYTKPGDAVLIQQPVYYPFTEVIEDNHRIVVSSDLYLGSDNKYHIDFADFEQKIKDYNVRLFLLCNPHNPTGRVFSQNELIQIGELCMKYNVICVSDEIHNDFVFQGRHTVFALLKREFQDFSVICTSPSKTFNLAGMLISNIFIPNPKFRDLFQHEVQAAGISQLSTLGLTAVWAAYTHGDVWYQAMIAYLKDNISYVKSFVESNLPGVKLIPPEGTYLLWLDTRGIGLNPTEIENRIIHKAKLWLDNGAIFGSSGVGFWRINIAAPKATIAECMKRLKDNLYD